VCCATLLVHVDSCRTSDTSSDVRYIDFCGTSLDKHANKLVSITCYITNISEMVQPGKGLRIHRLYLPLSAQQLRSFEPNSQLLFICEKKAKKKRYSYHCNRPWRSIRIWDSNLPRFLNNQLTDVGNVASLKLQPSFTPRKIPGTHFCSKLNRLQAQRPAERIRSIKKSNDLIINRTRHLLACSIVPQPTTLLLTPMFLPQTV
jgi:hypothetical protein